MAILDFCTGISQVVRNESTNTGSSTGEGYSLERISIFGQDTSLSDRKIYPSNVTTDYFWLSFIFDGYSNWLENDALILNKSESPFFKMSLTTSEGMDFKVLNSSGDFDTIIQFEKGTEYTSAASPIRIDIEFNADSSGSVNIYVDRALSGAYSGDLSHLSGDSISSMEMGYSSDVNSFTTYWSNIFFADEDTTVLTMVQSQVTGDGTYQELNGSYEDVECIAKTGDNSSIMSTTSGQKSSFTLQDRSGDISTGTIAAVGVYCRINQDTSGGDQARMFLTDGAGNETYTDYFTVDQYITPHRLLLTTDPNGGGNFDLSDVYNYEVGIEVSQS
jgi:hypothetical protein